MTEAEWLACDDPARLIAALEPLGSSGRKLCLFAVAGCYRCPQNRKVKSRRIFESVVAFVDGTGTRERVGRYWNGAVGTAWPDRPFEWAHQFAQNSVNRGENYPPAAELVPLARDIFGNPFRPPAFSSEWRTSTAVALARGMYKSQDFSPMPILADALQDAGCDAEELLAHCRGPGPHVRGCWVVDLVLGKG